MALLGPVDLAFPVALLSRLCYEKSVCGEDLDRHGQGFGCSPINTFSVLTDKRHPRNKVLLPTARALFSRPTVTVVAPNPALVCKMRSAFRTVALFFGCRSLHHSLLGHQFSKQLCVRRGSTIVSLPFLVVCAQWRLVSLDTAVGPYCSSLLGREQRPELPLRFAVAPGAWKNPAIHYISCVDERCSLVRGRSRLLPSFMILL